MNSVRLNLTSMEDRDLASVTTTAPPSVEARIESRIAPTIPSATALPSVRSVLDGIRQQADVPALAGGTVIGGRTEIAATGIRERGKPIAVTNSDQFHLGSNGKAMTSTLAAILVERGFLRWNSTIGELFPHLRNSTTAELRKVTLEQLLNHRGGFADEQYSDTLLEQATTYRGPAVLGRRMLLPSILSVKTGTVGQYAYSNVGYTVAATMMERATGNTYEWLMQKHLFRPLGMTSAGFGPPGRGYGMLDQPRGHTPEGIAVGNGRSAELPLLMSSAGLMHMNMQDWSKFLRVHLGERVNGVRLLSNASLTKLHTPDPRDTDVPGVRYGFGWEHIPTPTGTILWHNGSNGFWYSAAALDLQNRVAVFAATNQFSESAQTAVGSVLETLRPLPS